MRGLEAKLAVRSLGRNVRRTLLSLVGIAVGCALAALLTGLLRGVTRLYGQIAAESGAGHLRIAPEGWLAEREVDLRLRDGEAALAAARALPGVKVAAPRTRAQGLLALGTHVMGMEIVGVDPSAEPVAYRFVRKVVKGRYLKPGEEGTVVLGRELARRLDADVDDDLVLTVVGEGGQLRSAMFHVVGLVTSGNRDLDAGLCQAPLPDVARLSGREGIGEIAVLLSDARALETARAALAPRLPPGDVVLTWSEVVPELAGHLKQDAGVYQLLSFILVFLVLLGVASAQLTAVLERRRELAVMAAVGMRPWRLVTQMLMEAVVLGVAGAALALLVSGTLLWRLATAGLDLSRLLAGRSEMAFEGMLVEPRIYGDFGFWLVPYVLGLALTATVVASLYPAWFAARLDPAAALRVAQ